MNQLQVLFSKAKSTGAPRDIAAYTKAIEEAGPTEFLSAPEYIIRSSTGAKYLKTFAEKYGLSIPLAMRCESILEDAIESLKDRNGNVSEFQEVYQWLRDRHTKYSGLYSMYEWYSLGDENEYLEGYYGKSPEGKANRFSVNKMLDYGEEAIPDMAITAAESGTFGKLLEYFNAREPEYDGMFHEWVLTGFSEVTSPVALEKFRRNAPSTIVKRLQDYEEHAYREAVIMRSEMPEALITFKEAAAIESMINFKEFQMCGLEGAAARRVYDEILDLYEYQTFKQEPRTFTDEPEHHDISEMKPVLCILKSYWNPQEYEAEVQITGNKDLYKDNFGPLINKMGNGDQYTHAVLSFDIELNNAYDFQQHGAQRVDVDEASWHATKNLYVSVLFVPSEDYDNMMREAQTLVDQSQNANYSFGNLIKAFIAKPSKADNTFICSGFVGYLLSMGDPKNIHRDYARMRPEDLELLPRAYHVIDTKDINTYRQQIPEIRSRIDEIMRLHKDEIEERNNLLPRLAIADNSGGGLSGLDKFIGFIGNKLVRSNPEDDGENAEPDPTPTTESFEDGLEDFQLYQEAGEDIGLKFESYCHLDTIVAKFLKGVKGVIKRFNANPEQVKVDLGSEIDKFKEKVNIKIETHEIDIRTLTPMRRKVEKFRKGLWGIVKDYSDAKDKMAYGGNLWRGIIRRPKVLTKDIDSNKYENINSGIRQINRALDWVEKALLDLTRLASEDIDVINFIDRVYRKNNIYESGDVDSILEGIEDIPKSDEVVAKTIRMATNPTMDDSRPVHATHIRQSSVPTYLKNAHAVARWGEEDDNATPSTPDDFRRPSSTVADKSSDNTEKITEPDVETDEIKPSTSSSSGTPSSSTNTTSSSNSSNSNVQNYYYYTYTNSLNKNNDSFNKSVDNSVDNSRRSVDNSSRVRDDHSHRIDNSRTNNARVNTSTDVKTTQNGSNYISGDKDMKSLSAFERPSAKSPEKKDEPFHKLESAKPWEIDTSFLEAVGDADADKPKSDHPIKDTLQDIDRATVKYQQATKRKVQDAGNVFRAAVKPARRTMAWVNNIVSAWRDQDEDQIKNKMADPHARNKFWRFITWCIHKGALAKAGLLLNPFYLCLAGLRAYNKKSKEFRLRNEMIEELKTEMQIIDEKIKDADSARDKKAKYQLMRFKNEVNKKLLRVGGGKGMAKII